MPCFTLKVLNLPFQLKLSISDIRFMTKKARTSASRDRIAQLLRSSGPVFSVEHCASVLKMENDAKNYSKNNQNSWQGFFDDSNFNHLF